MEELIKRLERVIQTGAPDKDGLHPIAAEVVLEVIKELTEHGTNLAGVGTDTISRAKAIEALKQQAETMNDWSNRYAEQRKGVLTAVNIVEDLPPAQPRRGRWEMGIDERFVKCSECGLMTTRNELRGLAVFGKNEPNFCPNCGADMRGKQDGRK